MTAAQDKPTVASPPVEAAPEGPSLPQAVPAMSVPRLTTRHIVYASAGAAAALLIVAGGLTYVALPRPEAATPTATPPPSMVPTTASARPAESPKPAEAPPPPPLPRIAARAVLKDHKASVADVAFSPNGRTLATGSDDKTVKLRNATTGKPVASLTNRADRYGLDSMAFSPNGRTLATGSVETLRLWDVATRQIVAVGVAEGTGLLDRYLGSTDPVSATCVAFSRNGRMLASGNFVEPDGGGGGALLWNLVGGNKPAVRLDSQRLESQGTGWSVAFSPNSGILAVGSEDKTVRLWDVASHRELGSLRGHSAAVRSIAFSPDGRMLATSTLGEPGSAAETWLWDMPGGRLIDTLVDPLYGHTDMVFDLAFSPDGRTLATAGRDATVRLWDIASRRPFAVLTGHTKAVNSVAFAPDGRTLATGSLDATVRLWKIPRR